MRTKRFKSFLFAAILVFESIVAGMVPVGARTVSENVVTTVAETDIADEPAMEAEGAYTGTDGDIYWEVDANGHLTLSGNGDYEGSTWRTFKDKIKSATVDITGITDTSYMFSGCSNLTSVALTGLNTSMVETMEWMFMDCGSLTTLDLSRFDMSKVAKMGGIFENCNNLTRLVAPENNSATDMYLPTVQGYAWKYQLTGETVEKVTEAGTYVREKVVYEGKDGDLYWKIEAGHLTVSGNGDYEPRESTSTTGWLAYKDEIESATVEVTGITDTSCMFSGCSNLTTIDLSGLDTSGVENMSYMFFGCTGLKSVDLTDFNTSNVTNMNLMFANCSSLTTLKLTGIDTSSVIYMLGMFYACSGLTSLDVSGFDTGCVENMNSMFGGCSGLTSLDVSGFDTECVKDMSSMFLLCSGLTSLDISGFDTSSVGDMSSMFMACDNLIRLDAPKNKSSSDMGLPTSNYSWKYQPTGETVTAVTEAGTYVRDITGTDGALSWELDTDGHLTISGNGDFAIRLDESTENSWLKYKNEIKSVTVNVTGIQSTCSMFEDCSNLTAVDLTGLDTSGVRDMRNMFGGCSSLADLKLTGPDSKFDTSSVTSMACMFWECKSLKNLDLTGWKTSNLTDMYYMFCGCSSLTELNLSSFDTSKVLDMGDMFFGCNNLTSIIAPKNKSTVKMKLPVITGYLWKYQPTGTSIDEITEAGTYVREENVVEPVKPQTPSTPGAEDTVDTPNPSDDIKVETKVEIKPDGSVTKTETTLYPSGEIIKKIISTSKDQKMETIVDLKIDASGQVVDVTIEVIHEVKSSKITVNLNELKALADQVSLGNTAYIHPVGSGSFQSENVDSLGAFYEKVQDTLGVAQKKANVAIKISAKNSSGQKKYTVAIKKTDLTKKKFVVFASDKKNNAVMVNTKKNTAKVNKKKDLTLKIAKSGNYQVQNTKDAAKTNKKILKTVKPKKSSVTVKKGKSTSFKLATKCNKDNIQKITYSSDSSNVKVNRRGKMQAKASGTAKVTATVTMKNGKKKKIKMKVKVA